MHDEENRNIDAILSLVLLLMVCAAMAGHAFVWIFLL